MTAAACAPPDLGPLPPRFSGSPLSADTAVSEMRAVLAAEGVVVEREPSGGVGRCLERPSGRHAPERVDAALKSAFARARSEYGWRAGPDMGSQVLTLTKGNWTVTLPLPGKPAQGIEAPVLLSLTCVDGGGTPSAAPAPGRQRDAAPLATGGQVLVV